MTTQISNEEYAHHQTPAQLCKDLIPFIPLQEGDIVLEPFRGDGAFYDALPDFVVKEWCEIKEGINAWEYKGEPDWVITNPPYYEYDKETGKKRNTFYPFLKHFAGMARKGIAFIGSEPCLTALSPSRLRELNAMGWNVTQLVMFGVKKWRGRYFLIVLQKQEEGMMKWLAKTY